MSIQSFQLQEGIEYIKIHGLQRTCTNYIAELINSNFENTRCLINAGGWKHGHYCAPWTLGREVHVVTVVKSPYAWLVSLYNYWKVSPTGPDLTNVSFDQFVRQPAVFEEAAGTPYLLRAANPVQHWNDMNFHWMSIRMNHKKSLPVPYERLLSSADSTMDILSRYFGVPKKPFTQCYHICQPGQETPTVSDQLWQDKRYYENSEYLNMYTPELLSFINDELDMKIMEELGYVAVK